MPDINKLTIEKEPVVIRGKKIVVVKPAKLEEIFQGDPFLNVEGFPFWFKIWEAGIVLADYVASVPPVKKILEIGAGLGVPSLVAAAFGHDVLATEYQELPLEFIKRSAEENNLKLRTAILDWTNPQIDEKFDLIIGAEVVFKKSLFMPLIELFKKLLKDDGEVIIAHNTERKRVLVPFLYYAQQEFDIMSSVRKIHGDGETVEVVLNKLVFKKN
ncbi:MAG: methyltransferase [Thermodesulfobacteria bacterium]|nr:methyltransferase [Thermodesulfobacteriota bacterium]